MAAKWRHGNINNFQLGVVSIRDVKLNAAFAERQPHPEGAGFSANETEMIALNKVKNGNVAHVRYPDCARPTPDHPAKYAQYGPPLRFAGGFIALVGRVSHFA